MIVSEKLQQFYNNNNLDTDGGENQDFFILKFRLFSLKLPNSDFRKKVVYIHDIQHVLFDCDISWKGESFIAGWEIATGIWKHFPINIMAFWAAGFSFLNYPKEMIRGYKTGLKYNGIIDLDISKEELLKLPLEEVRKLVLKKKPTQFNFLIFIFWLFIAECVFFFPLMVVLLVWVLS
ncbi:hypothetical protein [Tenacibaculum sp. M341]|uniref:hypothetical protein n=1 Tax=Tenacibaculum sp. M341 TaxID=2530339 RepID=UPI001051951F|nr:hypothetical protein [Tenacibaculum sp. M341]TCI85190.1 hypothetical protein EYW44_17930 [Tenacibaculum sp. M341]